MSCSPESAGIKCRDAYYMLHVLYKSFTNKIDFVQWRKKVVCFYLTFENNSHICNTVKP